MWDMKQSTSWLQSCSTTYKIWGYLGIVEDYLKVHNKNFDFNSLLLSLTRPVIHYHQLSSTHQGPWGTPRSYHWKSFSNIRSNRQASWLFFSAAFLTSSDRGGPLWMSTCGWVQNLCSKSLHLNQTRRNPIICQVSFFFSHWKAFAPPTPSLPLPPPRNPPQSSPRSPYTLYAGKHVACIHNVRYTCVLYDEEMLTPPVWD